MTSEDFGRYLAEVQAEARLEHLHRWKEWYPVITTEIREAMGNVLGLKAEIARAMYWNNSATELAKMEPRISETLGQMYNMLGQIQGHLTIPYLLLEEAPSTSISPT